MSCTCGCTPCECQNCNCPPPVVNVFTGTPEEGGGAEPDVVVAPEAYWEPLQEAFVVPLCSGETDIRVINSDFYAQNMYVYIHGAGWFQIVSRPTATSIRVSNPCRAGNAVPGTNVAGGTPLLHGLPLESIGAGGPDDLADELTQDFTVPAGSANAFIQNTGWCYVGMEIYLYQAGFFTITAVISTTEITLANTSDPANVAPATIIPTGNFLHPVRRTGTQSVAGLSLFGRDVNVAGILAAITAGGALQYMRVNAAGTALEWGLLPSKVDEGVYAPGTSGLKVYVGAVQRTIFNPLYWSAGLNVAFPAPFTGVGTYFPFACIVNATGSLPGARTWSTYIERTANTGMTVFAHRSYDPADDPPTVDNVIDIVWMAIGY